MKIFRPLQEKEEWRTRCNEKLYQRYKSQDKIVGNLLLTLLGNTGPFLSTSLLIILINTQIALLILESAVAITQSYAYAVLSTLYSRKEN